MHVPQLLKLKEASGSTFLATLLLIRSLLWALRVFLISFWRLSCADLPICQLAPHQCKWTGERKRLFLLRLSESSGWSMAFIVALFWAGILVLSKRCKQSFQSGIQRFHGRRTRSLQTQRINVQSSGGKWPDLKEAS